MASMDALVDEYLQWFLDESPVAATMLGADGYDDRLPDLSAEGFARRAADEDRWLSRLGGLDDGDLDADERIDRELLHGHLRGAQIMRDWEVWRRNPDTYLNAGLMGVFSLFLHRPLPDPELVDAAVARLGEVPRVVDEGRANLDPERVAPLFAQRALGQCRAAVAYCRDLVPTEVEDDALRARLAEAGASAASAFASLLPVLEQLADEGGGGFAIGDERYSAMLRERELLDVDARGLRARGQEQYDLLAAELAEVAHAIAGHDDWRAVLVEANADRPETPEAMLAGYAEWTERAQRYLAEHGLVTLPDGESCRVVPSPPFQRPVLAVASYFAPPAFKPSLMGRFNVPYPPEGTSAEELAERLADNSYPSMPTTTVHEAYPGHHWHYVTMQGVRPLRRVASTSYFSEGWALYAERMMREQGFFDDPRYDLCHLDARIFRAARIIVDTSLHIGEMTYDEGVEFMHTKTSLTEPTARAEVGRYCSWPTQAASYLTGSLEIEKLRDRWLGEDHGDLREFHDRLCASGAMPPALAGRALFGS